jgi:CO/xanthine dehydrogenase FAD-binding subunit
MDYVALSALEDAWRGLDAEDALCLAGGQSLVAMMNVGLIPPGRLVSLRRIPALRGIEVEPDGSLRIGAMDHPRRACGARCCRPDFGHASSRWCRLVRRA